MTSIPDWHGFPINDFNTHAWIIGAPVIGTGTWIGAFAVLDGSGGLSIGSHCDISAGVQIYTHSTVMRTLTEGAVGIQRNRTVIDHHCHLGAGAIVLMGTSIGHHSVVGAGSVVLEGTTAPPHSLLVGNPARVLRRTKGGLEE